MDSPENEVVETPVFDTRTEMYVDEHPGTGEKVICLLYDGELALVSAWYTPEAFRALVAQAQEIVRELDQMTGGV